MTLVKVQTNRDITTRFGLIAAGTTHFATPTGDGRWLLYLWLPGPENRGRAVLSPPDWIVAGRRKLETAQARAGAHADYEHARQNLGWSHDRTIEWLAEGYGKSLKTLREWGFKTTALESAERRERQRAS